MPTKLPTKPADAAPDRPVENKFDPFRPEMPHIPGVGPDSRQSRRGVSGIDSQMLLQIGGLAAVVVLLGILIFWWFKSKPTGTGESASSDTNVADQLTPTPSLQNPLPPAQAGPTVAATSDEVSKPWAAKKFTFINPVSHQHINAMVMRLPSGELWAFSLQGPAGHCELEFVTDLAEVASRYQYRAVHPMVVSPCDGIVYDPLKVAALAGNTWVRGEIVQGSGLRPPISINVQARGRTIVADRIE
jgi:hypothetical protein